MNIFADQCVRLTCDNGVVSFCLESAASQYAGVTVHMPLAAFEAMQASFTTGLAGMAEAAQATTVPAAAPAETAPQDLVPGGRDAVPLGPKFASVVADPDEAPRRA